MDLCTPPRVTLVGKRTPALNVQGTHVGQKKSEALQQKIAQMVAPAGKTKKTCTAEESADPAPKRKGLRERLAERQRKAAKDAKAKPKAKQKAKGQKSKKRKTTAQQDQEDDGEASGNEEDKEDVAEENEESNDEGKTSTRRGKKRRIRLFKRRPITLQDKKLKAVKAYLARLGVTWQKAQYYHSRHAVTDADARTCIGASGFREMQVLLTQEKVPECLTCVSLMSDCGFEMDTLHSALEACSDPNALSPFTKLKERLSKESGIVPNPPVQESNALQEGTEEAEQAAAGAIVLYQPKPTDEADDSEELPPPADSDVFASVHAMKCLELLPRGHGGKSIPVRCLCCRSALQPGGKIFTIDKYKKKDIDYFVKQHCMSATHLASLERWLKRDQHVDQEEENAVPLDDKAPCEGYSLTHGDHRIAMYKKELQLWASCSTLSSALSKHRYVFHMKDQELVLFHHQCKKVTRCRSGSEERVICARCAVSETATQSLRNALRFAQKHWMAKVLHSLLFRSEEQYNEVIDQLKETKLYKATFKVIDKLLRMEKSNLQIFVRNGFAKMPKEQMTEKMKQFMAEVVLPSITVNVADCSLELRELSNQLSTHLAAGQLSEMAEISAKVAHRVVSGKFAERPALMGLLCQMCDVLDREERGVQTFRKVRKMSETERTVVQEAATMLILNGGNQHVLRTFGFNRKQILRNECRLDDLAGSPSLALLSKDTLAQNATLVDALCPRAPGAPARRLVLCVDFTYLQKMQSQLKLFRNDCIEGGAFCMSDLDSDHPGCMQPIRDQSCKVQARELANRMPLT